MADIYFTIIGTKYRYGDEFFKKKMKVELIKEADSEHDKEAIKVMLIACGLCGEQREYRSGRVHERRKNLR